jgi:hypothetical protein
MIEQAGDGKLEPSAAEARPETDSGWRPAPGRRVGTDPNQERDDPRPTPPAGGGPRRDGPASGDRVGQTEGTARSGETISRSRLILVDGLIGFATLLAIVGWLSISPNRLRGARPPRSRRTERRLFFLDREAQE